MISCIVGSYYFENKVMEKLHQNFEAGKVEGEKLMYVGINVLQNMKGITLSHGKYTENLENYHISPTRAMNKNKILGQIESHLNMV